MRHSSLFAAAFLLFSSPSSLSFAQHTSPPSPPPAAVPMPASTPAPAPAPAHVSAPTAAPQPSAPVSMPVSHTASTAAASPVSGPTSAPAAGEVRSVQENSAAHVTDTVEPRDRISSEDRVSSEPRIGENPPKDIRQKSEAAARDDSSDLRKPICHEGDCKEPRPQLSQSDLRHPICPGPECPCQSGQGGSLGKCVAQAAPPAEVCAPGAVWNGSQCARQQKCPSGEVWDGTKCVAVAKCPPGQVSNGQSCHADCSAVSSRAQILLVELRRARGERDRACGQDSASADCRQSDGHYQNLLAEYQGALSGAAAECRSALPDPGTQ
jgi:hypothetical protein